MVRPDRFELPTYWFVASCSIQLSYGRTYEAIPNISTRLMAGKEKQGRRHKVADTGSQSCPRSVCKQFRSHARAQAGRVLGLSGLMHTVRAKLMLRGGLPYRRNRNDRRPRTASRGPTAGVAREAGRRVAGVGRGVEHVGRADLSSDGLGGERCPRPRRDLCSWLCSGRRISSPQKMWSRPIGNGQDYAPGCSVSMK